MAVFLYNGVPMKQLPEWDKTTCPYAYLANANLFDFDHYMLRVMDRPGYVYERNGQLILGSEGPPYLAEYIIPKAEATTTGEWTVYTQPTQINIESELPNVFWSNTDIKKGDGSLWLTASDPIPAANAGLFDLKSWIRGYLLGISGPRPFMGMVDNDSGGEDSGDDDGPTPIAYNYNGLTLPPLPNYDKTEYPYAFILFFKGQYSPCTLFVVSKPLYVIDSKLMAQAGTKVRSWNGPNLSNVSVWTLNSEEILIPEDVGLEGHDYIVWSNHDIKVEGSNEVHFAASDPVPIYEEE